jgi:hypothetical protein
MTRRYLLAWILGIVLIITYFVAVTAIQYHTGVLPR